MADEPDERHDDTSKPENKPKLHPEGPHAREDLIDREKTPGTGSLPGSTATESDVGPD